MRRVKIITSIIIILNFLYANICFAYHVKITPVNEENYCEMKIGDTIAFTASGIGWDSNSEAIIPNAQITDVVWVFDSNILEEIARTENSITLKAIRKNITKLTVKAKIGIHPVEETIGVVIR